MSYSRELDEIVFGINKIMEKPIEKLASVSETPENKIVMAEVVNVLVKIANDLDLAGQKNAADIIDDVLGKIIKKQ